MSTLIGEVYNAIRYLLSKKSEPKFDNYTRIITNFSELEPKMTREFDINGRQYYSSGPSSDGEFLCSNITMEESDALYEKYVKEMTPYGPVPPPRYRWVFESMACHSYNQFRVDINKPGRIVVKCNITKNGWPSPWLYTSQNEGDINKPSMYPIDKIYGPRNYYWEVDMFETFQDNSFTSRISTAGHYGTQLDRKMKSRSLTWPFDPEAMHYFEVVWDGNGNWMWLLDSVLIHDRFIPQPPDPIYPYFIMTLAATTNERIDGGNVKWKVDYVKFSDNLIPV
jgi:hypothetical protein